MKLQTLAENAIKEEGPFFYDDLTVGNLELVYKRGYKDAFTELENRIGNGENLQQLLWELKVRIEEA